MSKRVKIDINNTILDLEVVTSDEDMYKGLSGVESLPSDGGMMFLWDKETDPTMVMRDMNLDLDFIAFDNNKAVKQVETANKDYEGDIDFKNIRGLIEVNKGFIGDNNIKVGTIFDLIGDGSTIRFKGGGTTKNQNIAQKIGEANFEIDDALVKNGKMYLLDKDGNISMELDGNERIFSIEHTEELFELAKKAEASGDYGPLGVRLKEIMKIHDTQEPEFAEKV